MKIKICGLTMPEEAEYLNEANVDFAGFIFFEKSKRNVTLNQVREIFARLDPKIKKAAVAVSPTPELVEDLQRGGFDILQIHKELSASALDAAEIPIWRAINLTELDDLWREEKFLNSLPEKYQRKVKAVVVDAAEFGSGKSFDWQNGGRFAKAKIFSPLPEFRRSFVLAGGLTPENVSEGIKIFSPDVVDVSSGVEGERGKDRELISRFVRNAREADLGKDGADE